MSPNARDRARDKRRHEKRQSVLAQREGETRRNKQVVGVVLAMLLVIGGLVGVSLGLDKDNGINTAFNPDTATPQASRSDATPGGQSSAPTPSASSTAPAKNVVAGCVSPPKVPGVAKKLTLPDKNTAAGKTFVATVTTNCGVITMDLDGTKAPQTVASFLSLAQSGYWADSPCHRLTTEGIFVLQCGDPTGAGGGNPGYGYGVENAPADFTFAPGTLAMARTSDPNSNGGQFFIVYKETVLQDATGYSIFGRITSGMDIVDKIAAAGATPPDASQNTAPVQPISILTVNVAEKKA